MTRSLKVGLLVLVLHAVAASDVRAAVITAIEPNGDVIRYEVLPNGFQTPPFVVGQARLIPEVVGLSRLVFPGAPPRLVPARFNRYIVQANGAVVDDWFLPANPNAPYATFTIGQAQPQRFPDTFWYWTFPGAAPVLMP